MTAAARLADLTAGIAEIVSGICDKLAFHVRRFADDLDREPATPTCYCHETCIVHMPGRVGGLPTVRHTRIPVATVVAVVVAGSVDDASDRWPHIDRVDVLVACWWAARQSPQWWCANIDAPVDGWSWCAWATENPTADTPDPPPLARRKDTPR